MSDFQETIQDLLRREYVSNMDHLFWCGSDNWETPWKECKLAKQHEDAGIDCSMTVMLMELNGE